MGASEWITLGGIFVTSVFAVIGYLLSMKDKKQEDEITSLKEVCRVLFTKHDLDAAALVDLQIKIAEQHYPKSELDAKFGQIEATLKSGFSELNASMKEMSKAFMEHLQGGK